MLGSTEASRDIDGVRRSEHPHRATFHVTAKPAEAGGSADEVREFDLTPEFKLTEVQEEAFAVAEAAAAAEASDIVIASRRSR